MPITSSDIQLRLSTGAGSGNGDSATAVPANSLGGTVSTTALGSTLFADATAKQNEDSETHYRCVFVLNNHATLTLVDAKVYISAQTAGGGDVEIAADSAGPKAKGAAYPQAARIDAQTDTPVGATFSAPTDEASALSLGDLGPGQVHAFWVKRTLSDSEAQVDSASFTVSGETAP